jgi:hypothetical protein
MLMKPIQINEVINNQQLCEIFLCAPQGGMRRSNRTNTLTLISDKTKIYDDKLIGDIYHYTGMGQSGDQKMSGQNKTLAESNKNEVEIHFFEVLQPRQYTYRGQVELTGEPYQETQPDKDGHRRIVWVFPLRLINSGAKFTMHPSAINERVELEEEFNELEQLEALPIAETEKERMIKGRVGQGKFKKLLLERECKCALCGVTDPRLLIASHIKPWKDATNEERLDVNNGLLLCANHDALFDKKFISFDEDGAIIISKSLKEVDRIFMNVHDNLRIVVHEKQERYFGEHRNGLIG